MRRITIGLVALYLGSGVAQATTVTIDFNEVTPVENFPPSTMVESQGYTFEAFGTACGGPGDAGSGVSADGIYFYTVVTEPFICTGAITMEKSDGGPFAILSLDAVSAYSSGIFIGTLSGGGSADLTTSVGTGDWLNLESFTFSGEASFAFNYQITLDDIVVTAVPVPAAVWLFASAIGLLGFSRGLKAF